MTKPPNNTENIHKVHIDKLVFGQRALGTFANGCRAFVHKALPSEDVEVYITKKEKRYAEAMTLNILKPAKNRIKPACPYFESCGGCTMQSLPYDDQLYWKKEFLRESLVGIAHISEDLVQQVLGEMIGASKQLRYRNKTEFAFAKNDKNNDVIVGYKALGRKYDLLATESCLLHSEVADKTLRALRDIASHSSASVFGRCKQDNKTIWRGLLKYATIRSNYLGQVLLGITTSGEKWNTGEKKLWVDTLTSHLGDSLYGVVEIVEIQEKGRPTKINMNTIYGKNLLPDKVLDFDFNIGVRSFFQVNREMAGKMISILGKIISKIPKKTHLLDLYCGNGFLGMSVSKYVERITGIDIEPSSIVEGRENMKNQKIKNYNLYQGDANKILVERLKFGDVYDIAIVDPPRAGLGAKACETLVSAGAGHIVYISCNPATLARDIRILLDGGYELVSVCGLDMFPQSYHLESISVLRKV